MLFRFTQRQADIPGWAATLFVGRQGEHAGLCKVLPCNSGGFDAFRSVVCKALSDALLYMARELPVVAELPTNDIVVCREAKEVRRLVGPQDDVIGVDVDESVSRSWAQSQRDAFFFAKFVCRQHFVWPIWNEREEHRILWTVCKSRGRMQNSVVGARVLGRV